MSLENIKRLRGSVEVILDEIISKVNAVMNGGGANAGTVTLTENDTSTTITDQRIGPDSVLSLMPTTANAAAALATTYIDTTQTTNGSLVIMHANNAQTDRTFNYSIAGT